MSVAASQVAEIVQTLRRYLTIPQITGLLRDLSHVIAYRRNQSFRQTIDTLLREFTGREDEWKTIIHEMDADGRHRLVVNGVAGKWAGYRIFAENSGYLAATDYYGGVFPEVFVVDPVRAITRVQSR